MGSGKKIENWFDRKIAQSKELDKIPGSMRDKVSSTIKSRYKKPDEDSPKAKTREKVSRVGEKKVKTKKKTPTVKGVRELNLGEKMSGLKKKLGLPNIKGQLKEKRDEVTEKRTAAESKYAKIKTGAPADIIVDNPWPSLLVMAMITTFFFFQAVSLDFGSGKMIPLSNNLNIHGETTVYLPEDHETTNILADVREYWSTDIIVIFIKIEDPDQNTVNITNPSVLREISYVEETLDPNKSDRGEEDEVVYCFSISTLVKEVNSTSPRLYNATIDNLGELFSQVAGYRPPDEELREYVNIDPIGNYSIPESQNQIDAIVNNLPKNVKNKIVRDTNNDTIWDTGVVVMGVTEKAGRNPLPMIEKSEKAVNERPREGNTTTMTVTGTLPLTDYATSKAFYYYGILMPLAITFLVLAILALHRSFKAVLIAGIPTGSAVVWIYGILALTDTIVTPTIIILGPVLLALGMSYGMHIANRFSQETDPSFTERGRITLKTTGNAVLMSAITTMVGFFSLAFGTLKPVTTVGWSLTGGIFFAFILTYVMAPSISIITKYEKKTMSLQGKRWKPLAEIPVKNSKKLLVGVIIIIIISISLFPLVEKDTDLMSYAPNRDKEIWGAEIEGFEKVDVMKTYSDEFNSGALGMVVIEGQLRSDDYLNEREDPVANLHQIEKMEDGINDIPKQNKELPVNAIGLVSILKSIGGEGSITTADIPIFGNLIPEVNISQSNNFWAVLNTPIITQVKPLQKFLLNVFYDTLSNESKGMVINEYVQGEDEYYSKTLIYVDMPVLSDKQGHKAVDKVNEVCNPEEDGPMYYPHGDDVKATKLTGVAAIAVAVNDLLMEQQVFSLVLSILLVLIVLSLIFKSLKLGVLTTIPVVMVIGMEPMAMVALNVPLNLATVMIGSTVIGAGVDFSVHITERMKEQGINKPAIRNSVEKAGPALFEATVITLAGLCSAFFVPVPSVYNFIGIIMLLLLLSALAALFVLPSIFTIYSETIQTKEAIKELEEEKSVADQGDWDVEWDVE